MKAKLIYIIVLLALISACSKNPNKTDAKIKISLGALLDVNQYAQSGAMLWGRNDKGAMFGEVLDGNDLSLELDNGQWTFWAIAWDGPTPGEAFTGTSRCAKTTSQLTGGDVQLSINLTNSTCNSADFSPANSVNAGKSIFPDISFYDCDKLSDHNGVGCGKNITNAKGSSRRLMMVGFRKSAGSNFERVGNALVSKCYTGNFTAEHLPLGDGHVPFYTVVQSFFSSRSCDETDPKGFYKDAFEMGLVGTTKGTAIRNVNTGVCNFSTFTKGPCEQFNGTMIDGSCTGLSVVQQRNISQSVCLSSNGTYAPDDTKTFSIVSVIPQAIYCAGKRVDPTHNSPHVFAGGTGIETDPYKICTEFQLNQIRHNYPSSHFALSSDLDMNKTSILGDQPKADCHVSEFGQNYNPIGGLYDASCAPSILVPFTGSFNGNNYQISNIRMSATNANRMGFIREGGKISNLTLKNISVEGSEYVGAFSGKGATALINLTVIDGDIRGNDHVGGVVGDFSQAGYVLSHLHAKKTKIELTNAPGTMGGLVGFSSNTVLNLSQSSFEGTMLLNRQDPTSYIGGLVGYLSSGVNISESFSKGSIITHGNAYVGGLVGKAVSSSVVSKSYSLMNIGPSNHNAVIGGSMGGFFGFNSNSLNISNSFFYGSIMHTCKKGSASDSDCSVSAYSGGGAGIVTSSNTNSALLASEWYTTLPTNFITATVLEGAKSSYTSVLGDPFIDVGGTSPTVKLRWEDDTCSRFSNNQPVATQRLNRGTLEDPIIICDGKQFREIKNFPALHYELGQSITVGSITNNNRVVEFTGVLDGKGHNIGGILDMASISLKGFIQTNKGRITNINFVNSSMHNSSNSITSAGLVAVNDVSGIISDNKFHSVSIFEGMAQKQGVIAGENKGLIIRNKISSDVNATNTAGIAVGANSAGGVIKGLSVNGQLVLLGTNLSANFGGVAGVNLGKISETATNASVINSGTSGQYLSTSFIGTLIGANNGLVEDVLVSHYARLESETAGSKHGQVFGRTLSNSEVKRLIAANEVAKPSTFEVDVKSFVNESDGSYLNSFIMDGSVFEYLTSARAITSCSNVFGGIDYLLAGFSFSTYQDGIYVKDVSHDYITKRISNGAVLVNSNNIINPNSGHFTVPCELSGIQNGKVAYEIKTIQNHPDITAVTPKNLKNIITYCASSNGMSLAEKPDSTCNLLNDEFDVVEDKTNGFGSNRLISAYKTFFSTNTFPENKPVWVVHEDDPYPKLFLAD